MNVLERVKNLIARAESNHVEEARTSAFMACRLIREHKLVVSLPPSDKPPAGVTHSRHQQPPPRDPFGEHFRGWHGPGGRGRPAGQKKTWGEGWTHVKHMTYTTTCVCGTTIPPGQEFWTKLDRAPLCDRCYGTFNQPV